MANKNSVTKESEILKELKASNIMARNAFAIAILFMGLQFVPATYTNEMRWSLSILFLALGAIVGWDKPSKERKGVRKLFHWGLIVLVCLAIISYIFFYIVAQLAKVTDC